MPYKVKFDYFDYLVYPSWDVPTRVHPDMVKEVGHFSINVLWEERYLDFSVIFKARAPLDVYSGLFGIFRYFSGSFVIFRFFEIFQFFGIFRDFSRFFGIFRDSS